MEGKLRVCAYCRVSTDSEEQAGSLRNQREFFERYISSREGWELTEIYADEGVSGTGTAKRREFLRMLEDAESRRFDRIITKEISRFARNTVDALVTVRRLRELGIGVTFLNDGIDTLAPEGELRLTILCSIAQEESRRTSERVRWGQKRRMEQGVVFGRELLGYAVRGGKLYVVPEEAETVRYIFGLYVREGLGYASAAARLNSEGIPPKRGKRWSAAAVARIISNEKYAGRLVQGKTRTADHLSHRRIKSSPDEMTVIEGHHEAIIPPELFDEAQRQRRERTRPAEGGRYSARYPLSGKIICGRCGGRFVSRSKKTAGGVYRSWRCGNACGQRSAGDALLCSVLAGMGVGDIRSEVERVTLCGVEVSVRLTDGQELSASLDQRDRDGRACAYGNDLGDTLPADPKPDR